MWKVKLLRPKPSISRPLVFAYGSQNRYPTHEMLSEHVLELTWMLQLKPFTSDFYDDLFGVVIPFLWGYLTKLVSRQPPSARPREPAWNLTMMTDPRLDISTKPQIPFLQMRTLFHALVLCRMGVATPFFWGDLQSIASWHCLAVGVRQAAVENQESCLELLHRYAQCVGSPVKKESRAKAVFSRSFPWRIYRELEIAWGVLKMDQVFFEFIGNCSEYVVT